jgi:hypothetical protein
MTYILFIGNMPMAKNNNDENQPILENNTVEVGFDIENTPWANMLDSYLSPLRQYREKRAYWMPWNQETIAKRWLDVWYPELESPGAKWHALKKEIENPSTNSKTVDSLKQDIYLCLKLESQVAELKHAIQEDKALQEKLKTLHFALNEKITAYEKKTYWYEKIDWPWFWRLTKEAQAIEDQKQYLSYLSLFKENKKGKKSSKPRRFSFGGVEELKNVAANDAELSVWQEMSGFFRGVYKRFQDSDLLNDVYEVHLFLEPLLKIKNDLKAQTLTLPAVPTVESSVANTTTAPTISPVDIPTPPPPPPSQPLKTKTEQVLENRKKLLKTLEDFKVRLAHMEQKKEWQIGVYDIAAVRKLKARKQLCYVFDLSSEISDQELKLKARKKILHPDRFLCLNDTSVMNDVTKTSQELLDIYKQWSDDPGSEFKISGKNWMADLEAEIKRQQDDMFARLEQIDLGMQEMHQETEKIDRGIGEIRQEKEKIRREIWETQGIAELQQKREKIEQGTGELNQNIEDTYLHLEEMCKQVEDISPGIVEINRRIETLRFDLNKLRQLRAERTINALQELSQLVRAQGTISNLAARTIHNKPPSTLVDAYQLKVDQSVSSTSSSATASSNSSDPQPQEVLTFSN